MAACPRSIPAAQKQRPVPITASREAIFDADVPIISTRTAWLKTSQRSASGPGAVLTIDASLRPDLRRLLERRARLTPRVIWRTIVDDEAPDMLLGAFEISQPFPCLLSVTVCPRCCDEALWWIIERNGFLLKTADAPQLKVWLHINTGDLFGIMGRRLLTPDMQAPAVPLRCAL